MLKCENCGCEFCDPAYKQDPYASEYETIDCCPRCGSMDVYDKPEEDIYEDGLEEDTEEL